MSKTLWNNERIANASLDVAHQWVGTKVSKYAVFELGYQIAKLAQEVRSDYEAALAAANKRIAELETSLDMRHDSNMRAIKQWQEATGEELKWPNHADLCVWLMQRIAELEAERDALVEANTSCAQYIADREIDVARYMEYAMQLEAKGEWEPVKNGHYKSQHDGSFIVVEDEWLQTNERIPGNTDMVDMDSAGVALPDNLRLCRRKEDA